MCHLAPSLRFLSLEFPNVRLQSTTPCKQLCLLPFAGQESIPPKASLPNGRRLWIVRGRDNLVWHVYKRGNLLAAKTSAQPSSEVALQQVIGSDSPDWGVNVRENENAQE
jgi:hypothetical protein